MNKLDICKQTRKIAANSLLKILKDILKSGEKISELELRNKWLKEIKKSHSIYPEGWYSPPPLGFGILFADKTQLNRLRFDSLRQEKWWPKENIFLDRNETIAFLYFSPVDIKSGIIGDFGITIYFGKDKKIQEIIKREYLMIKSIFNEIKIGDLLSDVHKVAQKLGKRNNFDNAWWVSNTDPTGTNYGHTIPSTEEKWTQEEKKVIELKDFRKIIPVINKKRKFLNHFEQTEIKNGMAITIEPRAAAIELSELVVYFHTIACFENGNKELLTNFDEIFKLAGMDYMLNH